MLWCGFDLALFQVELVTYKVENLLGASSDFSPATLVLDNGLLRSVYAGDKCRG